MQAWAPANIAQIVVVLAGAESMCYIKIQNSTL